MIAKKAKVRRSPELPTVVAFSKACCSYVFNEKEDEFIVDAKHLDVVLWRGNMLFVEFIDIEADESESESA